MCMISAGIIPIAREAGDSEPDAILAAAKKAGFDAVIWRLGGSLFEESGAVFDETLAIARRAGLKVIIETDPRLFPADHPLVTSHPSAFRLHRSGSERTPIDPRKPAPPSGLASARMRDAVAVRVFEKPLRVALEGLVRRGIDGLRIDGVDGIHPRLLGNLTTALRARAPELTMIGSGSEDIQRLCESAPAFDALVSSYSRWDGLGEWWFEEVEALRAVAPVINEVRLDSWRDAVLSLREAAAFGDGFIAPIEMLSRGEAVMKAAADAVALANRVSGFGGAIRRISGSTRPISAVLRAEAADLRAAQNALLILVNASTHEAPQPKLASLSSAGAAFGPYSGGDDATPLAAGEVRVLSGSRGQPIELSYARSLSAATESGARLVLESVSPTVAGGDFPIKRVVGDSVCVEATIFADGHEKLDAELRWRAADEDEWRAVPMQQLVNDRWRAELRLERLGRHEFVVEGWLDRFGGFQRDFGKKVDAGVAEPVERAEGRLLVAQAASRASR